MMHAALPSSELPPPLQHTHHTPARHPHPRQARNARQTEQYLLDVSRHHGRGRLNVQWTSNYQDTPGYVYVIVGRILDLDAYGRVIPPGPHNGCGCAIQ